MENGVREITNDFKYRLSTIDNLNWSEEQAEALYKFLQKHGAMKGLRLFWNRNEIHFIKKIKYPSTNDIGKDCWKEADKIIYLEETLEGLIRINRAKYNAYKATKDRIGQLWRTIDKYKTSLEG